MIAKIGILAILRGLTHQVLLYRKLCMLSVQATFIHTQNVV